MRARGLVDTAAGLGLHGHACMAVQSDAERRRAIVEYLLDGLTLGQRLMYVGSGYQEGLREDLDGLPGLDRLVSGGQLQILPLDMICEVGKRTDADEMLETYRNATDQALADGYTGLRVAAEVTALVADPDNWADHVRWEAVADRYMAEEPLSALCCYDRRALPDDIVSDLCCVHPAVHGHERLAPFRISAAGPDWQRLEGEIDYFATERLRRVLELSEPPSEGARLDLEGLTFADHAAVIALHEHARRTKTTLENVPYSVRRLADLMGVAL